MSDTAKVLKNNLKHADFWSLLVIESHHEKLAFRKGVQEPIASAFDKGALISVMSNGGVGYAATQDLTTSGLLRAAKQAFDWAVQFSVYSLLKSVPISFGDHIGNYLVSSDRDDRNFSLDEKLALLEKADRLLFSHRFVVDSLAELWTVDSKTDYFNSQGSAIYQEFRRIIPSLSATANFQNITETRTLGGAYCRQDGLTIHEREALLKHAESITKDAVDLVKADNCPTEIMDALIDPGQMMLQIHESIGHPLELDRILGDERNYAGTSFVTLDMFGTYQYGSPLLNVTFDPTIKEEFSTYAFDDEGAKAKKEFLIKDGILVRPLGGTVAQARAKIKGVGNSRSSSWNRPPIDRMANLNLEPGSSSLSEMISSIKKGIYLKSNSSWSIDDSRNKFQFGCEWGQLIENGKCTKIVRNPNYRGISANFWQNLKMVGDQSTFMVMGTPYCGKGEPNQCVHVGHASPICLFTTVDVFGGE